jgi:hypothetical protein
VGLQFGRDCLDIGRVMRIFAVRRMVARLFKPNQFRANLGAREGTVGLLCGCDDWNGQEGDEEGSPNTAIHGMYSELDDDSDALLRNEVLQPMQCQFSTVISVRRDHLASTGISRVPDSEILTVMPPCPFCASTASLCSAMMVWAL